VYYVVSGVCVVNMWAKLPGNKLADD